MPCEPDSEAAPEAGCETDSACTTGSAVVVGDGNRLGAVLADTPSPSLPCSAALPRAFACAPTLPRGEASFLPARVAAPLRRAAAALALQ